MVTKSGLGRCEANALKRKVKIFTAKGYEGKPEGSLRKPCMEAEPARNLPALIKGRLWNSVGRRRGRCDGSGLGERLCLSFH
jgi:hypothetical protein